jgi:hypothetical protein
MTSFAVSGKKRLNQETYTERSEMTGMRFPTPLNAHGRGQSGSNVRTFDGGSMSTLAKRDSLGVFLRDSERSSHEHE